METSTTAAPRLDLRARAWRVPRVDSTLLLAIAGLTAVGVAIRFSTLGLQSYHHDEVITAGRVLPGSFLHMLREIRLSESNPPLYYVIAWVWSKAFGTHEIGLRSLSALFGAATIPVVYLIGKELRSTRAGLITAAMVAVNPMLIWYSQEARSYALLALLSAASLLFFLRARRTADSSDLAYWALFSLLALWTHYFAVFAVAIEAAWLIVAPKTSRRALVASGVVVLFGLMLVPLAIEQANPHHIGWIAGSSLGTRAVDTAASFMIGETGQVIAEPPRNGFAIVPGILVGIGLALAFMIQGRRARRPAAILLIVGAGTVLLAAGAAVAGKDYVIARNLLPALIPLLAAAAVGLAGPRLTYTGVVLAVALCAYWLTFDVRVDATPNLQRPDWRDLAAQIGPARVPRAIVAWKLAADPLEFYLGDGSQRVYGGDERIQEVDVVAKPWMTRRPGALPLAFRRIGRDRVGRAKVVRYRAPRPVWLRIRRLKRIGTGFGANGVLVADAASLADSTVLRSSLAGVLRR